MSAIRPEDFRYLQDLVLRHSGIQLVAGKEYLAESRLSGIVHQAGLRDLEALFAALRRQGFSELHRLTVEAMTTTETQFFRDAGAFKLLRHRLLPELLRARQQRRRLRICSAACATGQEPYSIAMMIADAFPELIREWDLQIVALDLGLATLERASEGLYSLLEVNRGLPARSLIRHFDQEGENWRIRRELRQMVEFRQHNLCQEMLPGTFDLIMMRNVLMYFEPNTREVVLRGVAQRMAADGALLLGATESILVDCGLKRELREGSICYRSCVPDDTGGQDRRDRRPISGLHTT